MENLKAQHIALSSQVESNLIKISTCFAPEDKTTPELFAKLESNLKSSLEKLQEFESRHSLERDPVVTKWLRKVEKIRIKNHALVS